MASAKKILVGCLVAAASIVLLLVLLFAAYVAWGVYANHRADEQAKAFCAATRPGEDIARVLERAKGADAPRRSGRDGDTYRFWWYGMIFNASECAITTSGGRVVSTQFLEHRD